MIRIGILGDIGSGKSFVAKKFGYPVFNADHEVNKLYQKDKKIYKKLNKLLPKYINTFPLDKNQITKAILANDTNFKKIINIVHKEIRKRMKLFQKKNKNKKYIVLDVPLLIENKINNKKDILIFVDSKKKDIDKKLKKRTGFNRRLYNKFKKAQINLDYKKKISQFIIKNDFIEKSVNKEIKKLLTKIY